MDIDPIDDGPKKIVRSNPMTTTMAPMHISEEEEARQAIDMLRGDDVSARVAAANRLDAVAKTLGEERTREVSCYSFFYQIREGYYSLGSSYIFAFVPQCIRN